MRLAAVTLVMALAFAQAALCQSRMIEHAYGTAQVSGTPERIVSLSYIGHDFLLALDVKPIALRHWYGNFEQAVWPWAEDALGDADPVILYGGIDIERIAMLAPDLILAQWSGLTEREYALLSQIAPTIAHPKGERAYSASWQQMTRQVGLAVGREDEAEQVISDIEDQFEAIRSAHPEWQSQTAIAILPSRLSAFGARDLRGRFLQDLGFQFPTAVSGIDDFDPNFIRIPHEAIGVVDTDLVVWVDTPDVNDVLAAIPLRHTMQAFQEGREIYTDYELTGALNHSSPLSLPYALDRIAPLIEAATDGNPETVVPGWTRDGKVIQP
ncbi:MAG: iron-siderophore ABC transporter substrate-binding protein [Pseudomonadota bacterium]